jgi:signal transduction histidine kinase
MDATASLSSQNHCVNKPAYEKIIEELETQDVNNYLELAAFSCGCPISAIIFNTNNQKIFIQHKGLEILPENYTHFLNLRPEEGLLVINGERGSTRSNEMPGVHGKQNIGFYVGLPISSTEGYRVATLCVMHTHMLPEFAQEQENALRAIAHLIACMIDLKLNNCLMAQSVEAKVKAEKKISQLAFAEHDSEKGFLAHQLQENFAQTLAATKLYLEFAELSSDNTSEFIQKSRDSISQVITEINRLCRGMGPALAGNPDMGEVLEDMVVEWQSQHGVYVDFICRANLSGLAGAGSLALFHIVQQQLKFAAYCKAHKTEISILEKNNIDLYFTIHGNDFNDPDTQQEIFINQIQGRVAQLNGELSFERNVLENDVMRITIPPIEHRRGATKAQAKANVEC